MQRDVAQDPQLQLRQHQILPARRRFDALGEVVQSWTGLHPARVPQRLRTAAGVGAAAVGERQRVGARRGHLRVIEIELYHHRVDFAVERERRVFQRALPEVSLFARCRLADVEDRDRPVRDAQSVNRADDQGTARRDR